MNDDTNRSQENEHTFSVLVDNEAGVLHRVVGLFSGRGYNIDSLTVSEVEIDPETGHVEIVNYSMVDDVGNIINPSSLKGQIHGGIAQGIGQILMEEVAYNSDTGQLLSGSFMDYAMPRADNMCPINIVSNVVPTKLNPLGVKGGGEAGTVGAMPGVMNAIMNALSQVNVKNLDMPASPYRIWQAIQISKLGTQ